MRAMSICFWFLLSAVTLRAAPASQPDALPSADAALRAAEQLADKGMSLGQPRLFDKDEGLAVDRGDPRDPKVVAYVGASWVVPVSSDAKPGPAGFVLDRGTGRLVARAHEVVPMPAKRVYYVDEWQLSAATIQPGDSIGGSYAFGGDAFMMTLNLGDGKTAQLIIQPTVPGARLLPPSTPTKAIRFAGGPGKMGVWAGGGNYLRMVAISDDGSLSATLTTLKNDKAEVRFKDILAGLSPRPEGTRVWPSDARPRLSGVAGWTAPAFGSGDLGMWTPVQQAAVRPDLPVYGGADAQVLVAAKMMHPYDLPAYLLVNGLESGRTISSGPAEIGQWVGTERVVEYQDSGQAVSPYAPVRPPAGQATRYRIRLFDLHRDVRRLMIRCQAPVDRFAKHAEDFEKIIKNMKVSDELLEPIVVPLDPTAYKPRK